MRQCLKNVPSKTRTSILLLRTNRMLKKRHLRAQTLSCLYQLKRDRWEEVTEAYFCFRDEILNKSILISGFKHAHCVGLCQEFFKKEPQNLFERKTKHFIGKGKPSILHLPVFCFFFLTSLCMFRNWTLNFGGR